jgi:hypothetical protein
MRVAKTLILAAVVCMCSSAFADTIFSNQKGTLVATSGVLSVANSSLISVAGLPGYNSSAPPNLGSVKFTSGTLASGSIASSATFNAGGSFKITGNNNTGPGGFVFKGTFSSGSWTKSPTSNAWTFFGTITNGMIKEGHGAFVSVTGAVTTQLTTVSTTGNPFNPTTNSGSIKLAGGTTTFPAVVPEPGTLALFGTGLVGIGMLAKRRASKRNQTTA